MPTGPTKIADDENGCHDQSTTLYFKRFISFAKRGQQCAEFVDFVELEKPHW